jgi:hypothetical protein
MCKEAGVAYFEVLLCDIHVESEENHETCHNFPPQGQKSSPELSEYKL